MTQKTFGRTLTGNCPKKEKGSAGKVVLKGRGKMFDQFAAQLKAVEEKEPCLSVSIQGRDDK